MIRSARDSASRNGGEATGRGARGLIAAAFVGAGVLMLAQGLQFGNCLQDDAFISLRYARNLAEGEGLVYNPGERVEGYTNLSWTALHALPFAAGIDPTLFMRVAGLASGVAALLAAGWLARRLSADATTATAIGALLAGALPFLAAEAAMGLETAAFAALVALAVARTMHEWRMPETRPLSGLLFALAALTRPEGVLVAGVVGLADLGLGLRPGRRAFARLLVRWGSFAAVVGMHLAFRFAYYGDIVPNTFHAKVGGGAAAAARGLEYGMEFAGVVLPMLVLAAAGIVAAGWRARTQSVPGWWVPAVLAAVYCAYVVAVGGDYKPSFRFFAVPALLLVAYAAVAAAEAGRLAAARHGPLIGATAVAAVAAVTMAWTLWLGADVRSFTRWRAEQIPVHRLAGQWLGREASPDAWLATGNAGMVPYFSELQTIDMYGLTDRHIALRELPSMGSGPAGHEKGDGAYVLSRRPEFVLFQFARFTARPITLGEIAQLRMSVSEREIWSDPGFLEQYALESARQPGFYFNYFRRRGDR